MAIYKFAGFWRRFIAYMIDGFIIGIVFIVLMIIASVAYFTGAMSGDGASLMAKMTDPEEITSFTGWIWAFSILIDMAYFTYFHGSTGRTPGKMLLGLQVITADGGPVNFGIAFLRSVGYLVSALVFCLGYIWVGFDKKKQGWHDKIAGTVVIIREPEGNAPGISIPDSAGKPGAQSSLTETSGVAFQPEEPAPSEPSAGDAAEANNQKIP